MLSLNLLAAREHSREMRAAAHATRVDTSASPVTRLTPRYAAAKDAEGLRWLAELHSTEAPSGPVLLAEVDGRLRAALPLRGGDPIGGPVRPRR